MFYAIQKVKHCIYVDDEVRVTVPTCLLDELTLDRT